MMMEVVQLLEVNSRGVNYMEVSRSRICEHHLVLFAGKSKAH